MTVPRIGGTFYALIVQDDCTPFTRVHFLGKTSDAAYALELFPVETQADVTPFVVIAVRSDNGGVFFGGEFGKLCHKRGIK